MGSDQWSLTIRMPHFHFRIMNSNKLISQENGCTLNDSACTTQMQLLPYRYSQPVSPEEATVATEWWLSAVIQLHDIGSLLPGSQSNLMRHFYLKTYQYIYTSTSVNKTKLLLWLEMSVVDLLCQKILEKTKQSYHHTVFNPPAVWNGVPSKQYTWQSELLPLNYIGCGWTYSNQRCNLNKRKN